jgi:hypothetical protein
MPLTVLITFTGGNQRYNVATDTPSSLAVSRDDAQEIDFPTEERLGAAQLTLNNDLLPFLARETKFSAELTPRSHVYESSDQLTFAFTVVEEIIVGDSNGSDWSPGNLGLPGVKRKERIALGLDGKKVLSPEYYGSS